MFPRFDLKATRKIKQYFRDNPGAVFIIGFQLLLVVCAGLLIQGSSVMANEVATYAYFLLVVGVILQFIVYIMHRDDLDGKHDDG